MSTTSGSSIYTGYTALIGGSFDPFHNGHLHIGDQILKLTGIDKVVYLPCGKHNFKKDQIHASFADRLCLINMAISGIPDMDAWDLDDGLKSSGYTSDLMKLVYNTYPGKQFCFVIGADNSEQLRRWHDYDWLCSHVEFLIIPRPGYDPGNLEGINYQYLQIKLSHTSSEAIRKALSHGLPVADMLPSIILPKVKELYKDIVL